MSSQNERHVSPTKKLTWCFIALVAVAALTNIGVSQELNRQFQKSKEVIGMSPIDLLSTGDMRPARDLAVDTILQERKVLIDQLIHVVDPVNSAMHASETRSAAAYLLGEFRAVEAAPILSKALEKPWWPLYINSISRYDDPVGTALIKIGRPAVPALLENVENSDNEALRKQSIGILNLTLGGKRHLLHVLEKCVTRATDANVKRRLRVAIEWVEKEFNEDEEPLF